MKRCFFEVSLLTTIIILYWFILYCKGKWWPDVIMPVLISIVSTPIIIMSIRDYIMKKKAANKELVRSIMDS